jgi:hypothetical protein
MSNVIGTDWPSQRLGEREDQEVADELGCSVSTVQKARTRLGIPAYLPPGAAPRTPRGRGRGRWRRRKVLPVCQGCGERPGVDRVRGLVLCRSCIVGPDLLSVASMQLAAVSVIVRGPAFYW